MRLFGSSARRRCQAAVAAGMLALVAACGGGTDDTSSSKNVPTDTVIELPDLSGQSITINTYGGTFADAFTKDVVKPFEAATGATVKLVTTCCDNVQGSIEKKQFAGDIVLGNDYGPMLGWSQAGILKKEPRLAEIAKARGVDPDYYQDDLLAVDFYAYVLAWNTEKVKTAPTSWADLYDTKNFPGKRGLFSYPVSSLETALLATGTDPANLYPLDVPKALSVVEGLNKIGDLGFWSDGADLTNKLGTGEFSYAMAFSNRIIQAKEQGLPVDATFDQSLLVASGAAIPTNAKNVDGAVAFIDFYFQPEIQATFAKSSALAPAFPTANEGLDAKTAAGMVTSEDNLAKTVKYSDAFWADNFESILPKYNDVVNGK